jgi:hypothetical protein
VKFRKNFDVIIVAVAMQALKQPWLLRAVAQKRCC